MNHPAMQRVRQGVEFLRARHNIRLELNVGCFMIGAAFLQCAVL